MNTELKNYNVYENGLPFGSQLAINLDDLITRIKDNFASLIITDGGLGHGKTTLNVEIADYINAKHNLKPIVFEQQLARGGVEFLAKLRICFDLQLPSIIYSEAGDFNSRGALTRFNALLNRTFETFRAFKILVIIDLPSFAKLDSSLFDKSIPRLLLHLYNRTLNYGNYSGYSLYRMLYIKHKMAKLVVKSFAYDLVEPNFRGHFLNLDDKRRIELEKYTVRGKLKELRKAEIKIEGLINYYQLATKLNRSIVWVKLALKDLKVKSVRTIDRCHYFNEEVINILSDYIDNKSK